MTVDPAVLTELGNLRARLPELSASVLASADGMVLAHDAHDIEPDGLAALAAAHLALARRFAHAVDHGELKESVVQCVGGYISSYAAGPNALLTVVTGGAANLARVHLEARRTVEQLTSLLTTGRPASTRPEIPIQSSPSTPLARRTPMASLPTDVRHRRATG